MRWVLLVLAGGMLTAANLRYLNKTRWIIRILSVLAIIAAILHGFFEGFRAQMGLIDLMIILIALVVWIKKPQKRFQSPKSWVVIPLIVFSFIGFARSAALPIALSCIHL